MWDTIIYTHICIKRWLPSGKESTYQFSRCELITGSGRTLEVRNGNPMQYFCLENSIDRGGWWATVHGVTKSPAWLSDLAHMPACIKRVWGREEKEKGEKNVYRKNCENVPKFDKNNSHIQSVQWILSTIKMNWSTCRHIAVKCWEPKKK